MHFQTHEKLKSSDSKESRRQQVKLNVQTEVTKQVRTVILQIGKPSEISCKRTVF